jgi:hypothetical protein
MCAQEQGKVEEGSLHSEAAGGRRLFVDTVEEAIQHWTQMWLADAAYDQVVASNVQVLYTRGVKPVPTFISH